jgi:mannan endo-1,4-beta-mannosidase
VTGGGTAILTDAQRAGGHRAPSPQGARTPVRRRARVAVVIGAAAAVIALGLVFVVRYGDAGRGRVGEVSVLPVRPDSYVGLYPAGVPGSLAGVAAFTRTTGVRPDVVTYYSGWMEPFQARFAAMVAERGAVPLVQIDPTGIRMAAIASGRYDGYLASFAGAVRAYGRPVIVSFGHEMNGDWYSWGYRHASPAAFVAAWRHIVRVFRAAEARNVTWLWAVNVVHMPRGVPSPARWWPGRSFVTWVGIDGYYLKRSLSFASLFGPTVAAVRALTDDPILIAETAASARVQPAKISELFAGVRLYGLLGFVWFDAKTTEDWRLRSPAAAAAFRQAAKAYHRPAALISG